MKLFNGNIDVDNTSSSIDIYKKSWGIINVTNYDDLINPKIINVSDTLSLVNFNHDVKGSIIIFGKYDRSKKTPSSGTFEITAKNAKEPVKITFSWKFGE